MAPRCAGRFSAASVTRASDTHLPAVRWTGALASVSLAPSSRTAALPSSLITTTQNERLNRSGARPASPHQWRTTASRFGYRERGPRSGRRAFVDAGQLSFGEHMTVHRLARIVFRHSNRPERRRIEGVHVEMVVVRAVPLWRARAAESLGPEIVHARLADGRPLVEAVLGCGDV